MKNNLGERDFYNKATFFELYLFIGIIFFLLIIHFNRTAEINGFLTPFNS